MAYPFVVIPGTHAIDDPWWMPVAPFSRALENRGLRLTDEQDPFVWDTKLDGLGGKHDVWCTAGRALRWYAEAKTRQPIPTLSVIAHSHGGQVAGYAAAHGLYIDVLVTLALPIRDDMTEIFAEGRPRIRKWVHIYSRGDWWQRLGELFDGNGSWRRAEPMADLNIEMHGLQHNAFTDKALWDANNWWQHLSIP